MQSLNTNVIFTQENCFRKPINILEKRENSIIYELLPGKPNTKKKFPSDPDRVFQSPNKGKIGWYHNFNFIRDRIGKEDSPDLSKQRKFEKLASQQKKNIIKLEKSLYLERDLSFIELEKSKQVLSSKKDLSTSIVNEDGKVVVLEHLETLLKKFVADGTFNNMTDFIEKEWLEGTIKINEDFLKDVTEIDIEEIYPMMPNQDLSLIMQNRDFLVQKAILMDSLARDACVTMYDLKKSTWTPLKGIDKLINELKLNGPLCINGRFGQKTYVEDCFKLDKKIGGRDIFSWEKGAKRVPKVAHSVLIVGAKKINNIGYAYFIDPNDGSDPKDKSKQKIYVISFANLASNIADIWGNFTQSSKEYAYFGNFAI